MNFTFAIKKPPAQMGVSRGNALVAALFLIFAKQVRNLRLSNSKKKQQEDKK